MKTAMLAALSVAYGALAAALFRRFHPSRVTVNRIIAHVLEFRLFVDEPGIVFRAQRDLLRENLNLLRQSAIPVLILGAAAVVAYDPLDRWFGYDLVPGGSPIVVNAGADFRPPPGTVIDAPPVHVERLHLVAWRIRATPSYKGPPNLGVLSWQVWFLILSTTALATIAAAAMIRPTGIKTDIK